MAAGLGFKTFTSGEVLTAADTNGYLMQGILVFASASARNAAITSPQEGQFCFLKDTNTTEYYDGAAWVTSGGSGDVTGVTAGTGITVTDPTGPVPTVTNSMATAIDAKGDLVVGTGADAFSRLAVGTNDYVLTADSAQATGLKWAAGGAPTYTWTTYTPSNTGITVGNGTQTARYVKVGKTVFVSYRFVLGSTSSVSGAVYVGLPSTNASYSVCTVQVTDSGSGNYVAQGACDASAGSVLIRPVKTNATYGTWDDALGSMITFAVNDDIKFFITYEES